MKTGIALFVYNRPEHTKQTLEGLKSNGISKLYIFADGMKKEEHRESVLKVRNLIGSIDWCETEIIQSERNKGLANSIVYGVSYVLERHERVVVLEDDCVPAKGFIKYMEDCFDQYENQEKVMSVTGYALPIEIPKDYMFDVYFSYRSSSWGWGTWRRAWKFFNRDTEILHEIYSIPALKEKVDYCGRDLIPMLKSQIKGEVDSWSIYWTLNIIKNEGLNVTPVISKIINTGCDGSGTNCGKELVFGVEFESRDNLSTCFPQNLLTDQRITKEYGEFFSRFVPTEDTQRFKNYYHVLNKWLTIAHRGINVVEYFYRKGIENIAIYGIGELGKRFYEEVRDKDIKVVFFIDRSIKEGAKTEEGISIVSLSQCEKDQENFAIVVTPVFDFYQIKADLMKVTQNKVISLETVIDELFAGE